MTTLRTTVATAVAALGLTIASAIGVAAAAVDANPAFLNATTGSTKTVDHAAWNTMLQKYVVKGDDGLNRVAYGRFKQADHAGLKAYVARLEATDVASLDKPEQFAFWVNLYNAKTIDVVLDKYPVKSIKDISLGGGLKTLVTGGPWQAKITKVGGQSLSLDDIENTILRAIYKDARVHYAVNCASVGCPNLAPEAYTGAKLDAMLDAGARDFINSPRGLAFDAGKIKASSIYDWFRADFGGSVTGVFEHVRTYAGADLLKKLEGVTGIAFYDYDWTLADAKS
jgi:Protein of unknown function, DUF547